MHSNKSILKEGERLFRICNACRYCESICPVWNAMELINSYGEIELYYLSNLCHDCRTCYYVCPYTPPHEIGIDPPLTLYKIRKISYENYSVFPQLNKYFSKYYGILLGIVFSGLLISLYLLERFGTAFSISNMSFYQLFPRDIVVSVGIFLTLYNLGLFSLPSYRFLKDLSRIRQIPSLNKVIVSLYNVFLHRFFLGGGLGCSYPSEENKGNYYRAITHILIFYGFLLMIFSTIASAIYQDILGFPSPLPYTSVPVILGFFGGIIEIMGLLVAVYLKGRVRETFDKEEDLSLELLILLVVISGLLSLFLRHTVIKGIVYVIHMTFVLTLFLIAPFTKLIHLFLRYVALIFYQEEIENI